MAPRTHLDRQPWLRGARKRSSSSTMAPKS
jgi:hypothetical protein